MNFDYPRAFSWRGRSDSAPFDAGANCPVKINPWSALAKTVGKAVNADISSRLDGIEAKLDGHITMDDRRTADNRHARILHFNNRPLAKLSKAVKVADTGNQGKAESKALSAVTVTLREDTESFKKTDGVFNKDTFS